MLVHSARQKQSVVCLGWFAGSGSGNTRVKRCEIRTTLSQKVTEGYRRLQKVADGRGRSRKACGGRAWVMPGPGGGGVLTREGEGEGALAREEQPSSRAAVWEVVLVLTRRRASIRHPSSAISRQSTAVSHQPSAISYQPSAINHQSSVIGWVAEQSNAIGRAPGWLGTGATTAR